MTFTTITSRELNQVVSCTKRLAKSGPVFITDQGKPLHMLRRIEDQLLATGEGWVLLEALSMGRSRRARLRGGTSIDAPLCAPGSTSCRNAPQMVRTQVDWASFLGMWLGGMRRDVLSWLSVHDAALQRLGGVPATVWIDNKKTAVLACAAGLGPVRSRHTLGPHSSP